jgi:hypothetical protein
MKIGTPEHRDAFCAPFMQTYIEYDPKALPWPELDAASLHRLQSVPFWEKFSIPNAAPVRSLPPSRKPSAIRFSA